MLHYIHLTIDYGFTFTSAEKAPLHTYMTFPHSSNTKADKDALPPRTDQHHQLTTYRDSCWGSQISNAIQEGTQLPLFKFFSMSGAIIFRFGGLITWKSDCQDRTSLSSCKAKIRAINMGSCLTVNIRNMILHLNSLGYPIGDADLATPLYNDNKTCIKWCHNLTMKGNRHIEHCENATQEWVDNGSIAVTHISRRCNPSNIFTKEMHNGANFCCLCNSLMSQGSNFLKRIYSSLHPPLTPPYKHVAQTANYVSHSSPGMLDILISQPLFCTSESISCLSQAGQYILFFLWGGKPRCTLIATPNVDNANKRQKKGKS
jgi:hypothetical protein